MLDGCQIEFQIGVRSILRKYMLNRFCITSRVGLDGVRFILYRFQSDVRLSLRTYGLYRCYIDLKLLFGGCWIADRYVLNLF